MSAFCTVVHFARRFVHFAQLSACFLHTCAYVHIPVCFENVCTHMYACSCVFAQVCFVHACTHMHFERECACVHLCTCLYVCAHVHACACVLVHCVLVHVFAYVCACACVSAYVCLCMCVCAHVCLSMRALSMHENPSYRSCARRLLFTDLTDKARSVSSTTCTFALIIQCEEL